jgi:hypothetical protein
VPEVNTDDAKEAFYAAYESFGWCSLSSQLKASLFTVQIHKQVWNLAIELSDGVSGHYTVLLSFFSGFATEGVG